MPEAVVRWCARCWARWGGIGGRIFYIWEGMIYYTPIWDVLAPEGEREEVRECLAMRPRCPCSKLGRWCQLAFLLGFAPGLARAGFSPKNRCICLDTMYLQSI